MAWISTQPTAAGLVSVMGQRDVTPTDGDLPWSTSFPITRTVEENHIYDSVFPAGSAIDGVDHWFWQSSSFMDGKPDGQASGVVKSLYWRNRPNCGSAFRPMSVRTIGRPSASTG